MLAYIQSSVCRRLLQITVILLASQQHRGLKTNILQGSLYINVSTFLAHWKTISNTVECVDIVWNWPNEPVVAGFSGGSHRIDAALFTWRRPMSYVLWRQRGGPREGEEIHPGTLAVCWGAPGEGEEPDQSQHELRGLYLHIGTPTAHNEARQRWRAALPGQQTDVTL